MRKIYEEIRCDYHTDGFWTVDAWLPGCEEGKVIALINDVTGDDYAVGELDDEAKRIIEEKCQEIKNDKSNPVYTYKHMENAVNLSADMYLQLGNYSEDMREKAAFIIGWAEELESRLGGKDEDEGGYDYVEELEKIEAEMQEEIDKEQFGDPDDED